MYYSLNLEISILLRESGIELILFLMRFLSITYGSPINNQTETFVKNLLVHNNNMVSVVDLKAAFLNWSKYFRQFPQLTINFIHEVSNINRPQIELVLF